MLPLLVRFRQIDRRIISTLVFVVLGLPLLLPLKVGVVPFPATRQLKAVIDALPKDKLIVVACDWDASVKGECDPLTTAMMDYLMREGRPFAIFGLIPQGPELAQAIAEDLAAKHTRLGRPKAYGTDWVNWGYRPNYQTTLIAMMNDVPGTLKTDIRKQPLTSYPMMRGVRTLKDAGLIYEVTGTGLLDVYIQFVTGVPLTQGCTAVVGPQQYPYLQSGQLKGLLVGLGGAAQFETITDFRDAEGNLGGQGLQRMSSQSLGHLLIMLLIVLGNLGVWAGKKLDRLGQRVETPVEGDRP